MKSGDGISVEEQQNDNNSLLNYYKKMIQLKQSNAALAQGKYANAPNSNSQVFSFYRMFETEKVLVAVNLSNEMQAANFKVGFNNYRTLFGKTNLKEKTLQLSPYEVVVLKLK
jgi:glycosidase